MEMEMREALAPFGLYYRSASFSFRRSN